MTDPLKVIGIAIAATVATLSLVIQDSLFFSYRQPFVVLLAGLSLTAAIACGRARRRRLALLLAATSLLPVWQGLAPGRARDQILHHSDPGAALIFKHFIAGYGSLAAARDLVTKAQVGGIFLSRRNVAGRSAAELAREIAYLQALRREAGLPPLIVAADQEGGPVSRLSPPLPKPPPLSTLAALPRFLQRQAARALGNQAGADLATIGVTLDLAPVADLAPSEKPGALDWNTKIGSRAISSDPETTSIIATGFAEGLLDQGITPTVKHFPGLGRVTTDTHLFAAALDTQLPILNGTDWVPFKAILQHPGVAIMLAHVSLTALDRSVPASQSRRVVSDLLRKSWGFGGIAITDDLSMRAAEQGGLCQAVTGALNAGVDLLLVAWDTDKIYPALQCARDALNAGRLDRDMLEQSDIRLKRFQRNWTGQAGLKTL